MNKRFSVYLNSKIKKFNKTIYVEGDKSIEDMFESVADGLGMKGSGKSLKWVFYGLIILTLNQKQLQ